MLNWSASEIAIWVGGILEHEDQVITHLSPIEEGDSGSLTFLGNPKYAKFIHELKSAALLCHKSDNINGFKGAVIRVENVYHALSIILTKMDTREYLRESISNQAIVDSDTSIDQGVSIGEFAVIRSGAVLERGCKIYPHVYIGEDVHVGKDTIIHTGARILRGTIIGAACIIHPNAVIGSDGFGYAKLPDQSYQKIPQVGKVIIGDRVEVGANTTIDRASIGTTKVLSGVKLDNLIQVGHNVTIGKDTVIAAQTGISGSTKIGDNCVIGGQVGFVGHLTIAPNTMIQAQSGIASGIHEPGQKLQGTPALSQQSFLRSYAHFKNLTKLNQQIQELQKQIIELQRNQTK